MIDLSRKNIKLAGKRKNPSRLEAKTIFALSFIIVIIAACTYLYYQREKIINYLSKKLAPAIIQSDLITKNIYIDGCNILLEKDILAMLNMKIGENILSSSPWELKERIEKNPWVKSAVVDRQLPNDLYIGNFKINKRG